MSINSSLLQGIRSRLGNVINPNFTTVSDTSDLFEAYIFSIVLRAAINEGASISYKNVLNNTAQSLVLRRSPGKIHSTAHLYTHAVVEFPNKPSLEVHLKVRIQGRSRVLHECDLSVIHQEEADSCRARNREPRSSKIALAVECKHYTSQLKLDLARSFIGLTSELRVEGDCYFVSNSASESVAKLLAHNRKKWEHNIVPGSANDVNRLMYSFQSTFKDFKARH